MLLTNSISIALSHVHLQINLTHASPQYFTASVQVRNGRSRVIALAERISSQLWQSDSRYGARHSVGLTVGKGVVGEKVGTVVVVGLSVGELVGSKVGSSVSSNGYCS